MSRFNGKTGVMVAVEMNQHNGNLDKHRAVRRSLQKICFGNSNSTAGNRRLGSLRHSVFERIAHLKTAEAADIEMDGLFPCEVYSFTCEITDAQGKNVPFCHGKIVTITHNAIFFE